MEGEIIFSSAQKDSHERFNLINLIDLNEPPDDILNDTEDGKTSAIFFEPFIGQCFLSEEEAYRFYENFARETGFSRRDFFCHREGFPKKKIVEPSKEQRNRTSSRCGCKVHMRITLKKCCDIFPEEWHVTEYNSNHNHELLALMQVRFLPSYRIISKDDEQQLLLYKEAGLSVKQIMRVMELQKNVKHGDLPFFQKDLHNFFGRIQRENLDNDAMELLEYCKKEKMENPHFQFDYGHILIALIYFKSMETQLD